jgi:hypothetical protein
VTSKTKYRPSIDIARPPPDHPRLRGGYRRHSRSP